MILNQNLVLVVEASSESFHVQCLKPEITSPTISIAAGDSVTVEVDLARPHAPVSTTIHDVDAAAVSLCDLFGTTTARELLRLQTQQPETKPVLTFSPGPGWPALVVAAYQQWMLFWNPLPLDGSLYALDTVAAAHQNQAFGGASTARRYAQEALPAGRALERLLDAGQIAERAVPKVRAAIEALNVNLMPGTADSEMAYTLPLPLSALNRKAVLYSTEAVSSGDDQGLLLIGSPDWRLSGLGLAASAEDVIQVRVHDDNPYAITITVPTAAGSTAEMPDGFEAVITEPHTGSVIARSRLIQSGRVLRGHSLPLRPVRPTDHVDIHHASLKARPEVDPQQRIIDRRKRDAARQFVEERLDRLPLEGPLPATLLELAQSGNLLVSEDSAIVDDLEIFLFTHTSTLETTTASRSTGATSKKEWAEYKSTETDAMVYVDDRGETVRVWLKNFEQAGHTHVEVVVSVTFSTTAGLLTTNSGPITISTIRPNHYVNVAKPLSGAAINQIQVSISPSKRD